jgi:MinD superfamily P-loop ATPase
MKQLVILSGKGGTGKTCISAAIAHLSSITINPSPCIFVDADVDAANLSLILKSEICETHEFWGGSLAEIDPARCTGCEACVSVCRYDAIFPDANHFPACWIDPLACDGCAACAYACPENAVRMIQQQEGHWYRSTTPYGELFHAELFPGKENSGKLVTLVKQQARLMAEDTQAPYIVIDGPPGIGCPVISACAGANLGLIVAEPSLAGLHDLQRALSTLQHFRVPPAICINKADLYPTGALQIRAFAKEQGIEVLGDIPFDELVPQAMLLGAPITAAFPDSLAAQSIRSIMTALINRLLDRKA